MILTKQQTSQLFGETGYKCSFNEKRFSYLLFRDQMSPFGDIITFQDKVKIGPLSFEDSLIFCLELPNTNMFGGVCFQRLFSTLLGSFLSEITQKEVFVNEGCIIVNEKQSSLNLINIIKSSILIHMIFPKGNTNDNFHSLDLSEAELEDFQNKAVGGFHQLAKSIFLQTQHDNF